jgi:tetratricopeptide (TPR) repeat protein
MYRKEIPRAAEWLLKGLGGIMFLVVISAAASPAKAQPAEGLARIKKIFFNAQPIDEPISAQVKVTRARNKTAEPGLRGTALYDHDELATGAGIRLVLVIRHPELEKYRRIIISSNTRIRIRSESIFLYLGKISVSIRGLFEVKTNSVSMMASGTEFECELKKDDALTLVVLNGRVRVQKGNFKTAVAGEERPDVKAPLMVVAAHPFLASAKANLSRMQNQKGAASKVVVGKREELIVMRDAPLPRKANPLTNEQVRTVLDWTNQLILADAPNLPAKKLIPHYDLPDQRAAAFKEARFRAVVESFGNSHEILGNVFSDWGDGASALAEYEDQLSNTPDRGKTAEFLTNLGEAYRLTAEDPSAAQPGEVEQKTQLDKAEQKVRAALQVDARYAPAYNARGNISADRGKAVAISDPGKGSVYLENALEDYRRASETNLPKHKAVAKANEGFVHLDLGELAEKAGQPQIARNRYEEARQAFIAANEFYPRYPYGEAGLIAARGKLTRSPDCSGITDEIIVGSAINNIKKVFTPDQIRTLLHFNITSKNHVVKLEGAAFSNTNNPAQTKNKIISIVQETRCVAHVDTTRLNNVALGSCGPMQKPCNGACIDKNDPCHALW